MNLDITAVTTVIKGSKYNLTGSLNGQPLLKNATYKILPMENGLIKVGNLDAIVKPFQTAIFASGVLSNPNTVNFSGAVFAWDQGNAYSNGTLTQG